MGVIGSAVWRLWYKNKQTNKYPDTRTKYIYLDTGVLKKSISKAKHHKYLIFYQSDKGLKGIAVNSVDDGSLEITSFVPFVIISWNSKFNPQKN